LWTGHPSPYERFCFLGGAGLQTAGCWPRLGDLVPSSRPASAVVSAAGGACSSGAPHSVLCARPSPQSARHPSRHQRPRHAVRLAACRAAPARPPAAGAAAACPSAGNGCLAACLAAAPPPRFSFPPLSLTAAVPPPPPAFLPSTGPRSGRCGAACAGQGFFPVAAPPALGTAAGACVRCCAPLLIAGPVVCRRAPHLLLHTPPPPASTAPGRHWCRPVAPLRI